MSPSAPGEKAQRDTDAPPAGRPARSTPRARALRRCRAVLPPLTGAFLWFVVFPAERLVAQQIADTSFRPAIAKPAYPVGAGPVVQIDEGHRNFHQADGRYRPFAELLRRDGYVVRPSRGAFTAEALRSARLLVISNAAGEEDGVSAFNAQEIAAVRDWVAEGGSLLLIADHHPWSTAAEALGREFGVRFRTGFVKRQDDPSGRIVFTKSEGTLPDHPITAGLSGVASFAGSAFEAESAEPLLVFGPGTRLIVGNGSDYTNASEAKGLLQGAVSQFGRGRLAVFGEAAMFTAQLSGADRRPMGMNAPIARENAQFVLNVLHWLTGVQRAARGSSNHRHDHGHALFRPDPEGISITPAMTGRARTRATSAAPHRASLPR